MGSPSPILMPSPLKFDSSEIANGWKNSRPLMFSPSIVTFETGRFDFSPPASAEQLQRSQPQTTETGILGPAAEVEYPPAPDIPFREFVQGAWLVLKRRIPFHQNWHIDCLSEHLEALTTGEITQLLITIPPRFTKSTLISVSWPAWEWTWQPWIQWLCASYDLRLALRDAVAMRHLMQSDWYRELAGDRWHFTGDQNVKSYYTNSEGGHRVSTSPSGGGGTGYGGDRIIVDDPHNVKQSESEAVREGTLSWWDETMTTRVNDPQTTRECVVGQRTHMFDLQGKILAEGGWHHLNLPMRYESRTHAAATAANLAAGDPEPHDECGIYPDPRIAEGDLLDPERFPAHVVERMAVRLGIYAAAAQFQQRPVPREGALFKDAMFKPLPAGFDVPGQNGRTLRQSLRTLQFWDLAYSIKDTADYTSALTLGVDEGLNCYIEHVWWDHIEELQIPEDDDERGLGAALARHVLATRPTLVGIWSGAFTKKLATQRLALRVIRLCAAKGWGVRVIPVPETTDKGFRAQVPAGHGEAGMLYADRDATWWAPFITQLLAFPKGDHDDLVDALSGAVELALRNAPEQIIHATWTGGKAAPDLSEQFIRIGGR